MDDKNNIEDDSFFDVHLPTVDVVRLSHMNNKSSVLCPENQNITGQYLALQQLDAHQKMIARAKGIVDTLAPQSLQSYRSVIDRRKKKLWQNSTNHSKTVYPNETMNSASSSSLKPQAAFTDDEDNASLVASSVSKAVQTGIPFVTINSTTDDKIGWYLEALSQGALLAPPFVYVEDTGKSSKPNNNQNSSSRRRVANGDILDTHVNCFIKSKKAFSPRILANVPVQSKIKEMRCYNPPMRRRKKNSSENSSDTFESYDQEEDSEVEEKLKEKIYEKSSDNIETEINRKSFPEKQFATNARLQDYLLSQNRDRHTSHTRFDHSNRNDEDQYLDFLSKVTEDILRSGVYSDRAIQQAFDFHLQFYQEEANKDKLQSLLTQVMEGLKISNDDSSEILNEKRMSSFPNTPPEKEISTVLQHVSVSLENESIIEKYELDLDSEAEQNRAEESSSGIHIPQPSDSISFRLPDS